MYPRVNSHARLHSHLPAAPYVSHWREGSHHETTKGLTVNIWQDPNDPCAIQGISIRVNWLGSLGLLVMRYRMTVLAWTIGLGALIVCAQYQQYRLTGTLSLLPMEH